MKTGKLLLKASSKGANMKVRDGPVGRPDGRGIKGENR